MALDQSQRLLYLDTPLGKNELLLTSFVGVEEISRLFHFNLDLLSDNNAIKASDIVGSDVTFGVRLADDSFRYFHGFVNRFIASDEREERREYRAQVVPWLWFLTRTADCRIFQEKSVPDIIEQIFGDLGFNDYQLNLQSSYSALEYCVQYRETDFTFVSRLMEETGIYYYFKHEDGKHTMVIADRAAGYYDLPESTVDYPDDFGPRAMEDHLMSWEHQYEFRSGKWAQTDYNFTTPSADLMTNSNTIVKLPGTDKYEFYDYPGCYEEKGYGQTLTDVRMEEEEAAHDIVYASSNCRTFSPGGKFKVRQHRCSTEEGNTFVITRIEHKASESMGYETGSVPEGDDYHNSFQCIPESVNFRPVRATRRPYVQGLQTATVVGPSGEEIYTDEYGRVKVQFPWDREGKNDEQSSCWMRVSQIHAGKNFGAIDIPRIGEEVIVDFLECDPDRPIITGRVYHAENMPPYSLPDKKVVSGIKTKTYKGDGYNEYIMDDSPGEELIREHGQYDKSSTIQHDLGEQIGNNRTRDVGVDESVTIGNHQTISVGNNRQITVGSNHLETISSNMTINVGANLTEVVGANYAETVGASMALTVAAAMTQSVGGVYALTVGGPMTVGIGGSQTTDVGGNCGQQVSGNATELVKGNLSQQIKGKHTEKVSSDYKLKSGSNVTLEAASKITLKTGASSITMTSGGQITIKGTTIKIEGSQITEKAATIKSQGSATNEVSGAMVTVKASGINTVKGAVVKIN